MPNRERILTVPDSDRVELERRARSKGAPARVVERARIVLLAADGLTGPQIAERAGCTEPTVVKWRRQYAESGLAAWDERGWARRDRCWCDTKRPELPPGH
jgi:CRP-like cAMP-binding protein